MLGEATLNVSGTFADEAIRLLIQIAALHGDSSWLRRFSADITALYQLRVTLDHLERGRLPLAPEADVELMPAEADVVNGQVGQPFRTGRVDIQPVARRVRQKAQ